MSRTPFFVSRNESQRVVSSQLQQSSTGFPARPQLGIRIQPLGHTWDRYESPQTGQTIEDRYAETMVHFFSGRAPRPLSSARSLLAFSLEHCQDPYAGTRAVRKWANGRSRVSVYPCGTCTVTVTRRAHVAREQAGETKRPGPRRTRRVKFTPPCVL
jgi:hypothetical protein